MSDKSVSILKTIWSKQRDGQWGIQNIKGLTLTPKDGEDVDYFAFKGDIEILTSNPSGF